MYSNSSVFAVLVVAGVLTSASANAAKSRSFPVQSVWTQDGQIVVSFKDQKNVNKEFTGSNFLKPYCGTYRGVNMALCLASCDGASALVLESEPNYTKMWREFEVETMTGIALELKPMAAPVHAVLHKKRNWFKVRESWILENLPGAEAQNYCEPASQKFDGKQCMANLMKDVDADRFLQSYSTQLKALSETSLVSPLVAEKLARVSQLSLELNQRLAAIDRTEFQMAGALYQTNFNNFPTLYCQLAGRKGGQSYAEVALVRTLAENEAELREAIGFLAAMN